MKTENPFKANSRFLVTQIRNMLKSAHTSSWRRQTLGRFRYTIVQQVWTLKKDDGLDLKTYTYNYLLHKLRSLQETVSCSALTGIAAILLIDGKTVHRTFRVPVPCLETSSCCLSRDDPYADQLRHMSCFIIDEASMKSIHIFNSIDRLMRDLTGNGEVPFGGKIFLTS